MYLHIYILQLICTHIHTYGHITWNTRKDIYPVPLSSSVSHTPTTEKHRRKKEPGLSGGVGKVFAGSKITTFWVVSEEQPFEGEWWPYLLPLFPQPSLQPACILPMLREAGTKLPLAFPRWSTTSLEQGREAWGAIYSQPTQARNHHAKHEQGSLVCLETVPRASSCRNIGFSGSSSLSPVPLPLPSHEGPHNGGMVGQALGATGVQT